MAVTLFEDTTLQTITTLDGVIGSISTDDTNETQIDDAFGAVTNAGDNDATVITTSHTFPEVGPW